MTINHKGLTREGSKELDRKKFMTLDVFAREVGESPWTIRSLVQKGFFDPAVHPNKGGRGKAMLFHPDQVAAFRKGRFPMAVNQVEYRQVYTGEEAQKVFVALEEGRSLRWIVQHVGVHPDVLDAIIHRWNQLEKGIFVTGRTMEAIAQLALEGPEKITNEADLLEMLKLAAGEVKCSICKKSPRDVCRGCVRRASRMAVEQMEKKKAREGEPPEPAGEPTDPHA